MENLNANWFFEGLVDFEYKKYVLLAYLDHVRKKFNQTKLYPQLSDLVFHYRNLTAFLESKSKMSESFPQTLAGIDAEKQKLEFETQIPDDEIIREISMVAEFALPKLKNQLEEGRGIYEFIEDNIEIDPVGILPLYKDDGYLLLHGGNKSTVRAYDYRVSIIENSEERFRSIRTSFVTTFDWGITNTFEDMKLELIRSDKSKPNPATFLVLASLDFPEQESLMPVAKRKFIRYLASFSA